jgi:hypothetical protein
VICWGRDDYGQASPPASVDGTSGTASAIKAGGGHSCAIHTGTGSVVCWGFDNSGQSSPPASVDGTNGTASAIETGADHNIAIQTMPEPGALMQLGAGIGLLALLARRRRAASQLH